MLEFLVSNWQILASLLLAIISLIIAICRKRNITSIESEIMLASIDAVLSIEKTDLKGSAKLQAAINQVVLALERKYPNLNVTQYIKYINTCIELILKTPQKKGE